MTTPLHGCIVGTLVLASNCFGGPDFVLTGSLESLPTRQRDAAEAFRTATPNGRLSIDGGRVERVAGRRMAIGATPSDSAWAFMSRNATLLGAEPQDLTPMGVSGRAVQGLRYNPATGEYEMAAVYFRQIRGGIPVYGSHATVVTRQGGQNGVALAVNNLRDLGTYQPGVSKPLSAREALSLAKKVGPTLRYLVEQPSAVIWAEGASPVLATRFIAESAIVADPEYTRQLFIVEQGTNNILHREELVLSADVTGSVRGFATPGLFPDRPTNPPVLTDLFNANVIAVTQGITVTDILGQYIFAGLPESSITFRSEMTGPFALVANDQGTEILLQQTLTPPAVADFIHNESPSQFATAQVNGFVQTNIVHDFVSSFNPTFPGMLESLLINVNLVSTCNAQFVGNALNFRQENGPDSCPNTAYSTVVYHEYGHFIVDRAGSVQGAYGEGMGDVLSVLVTDDPNLGQDFFGPGTGPLRNAINSVMFPCNSSDPHVCGQVLAGAVWNIRDGLLQTNPETYREILSQIAIDAVLLNPPGISPGVVIDYLTLDDNDDDIFNGTPHFAEITSGFAAKGVPVPALKPLKFTFPQGIPTLVNPLGGTPMIVHVEASSEQPAPNSGVLHVTQGNGPFADIPMNSIGDNEYLAVFPATNCGAEVSFYVTAQSTGGTMATEPSTAPSETLATQSGGSIAATFSDNFEGPNPWIVTSSPGLTDGAWNKGIPAGDGDRGDPTIDADGSGQCFLTDNQPGNSDVDDGSTTLTSPPMNATIGDAHVRYWRWYSNTKGNAPMSDVFTVQISNDNLTWVNLEVVGPGGPQVDGGWFQKTFRVADFVTPTTNVRIRFVASDLGQGSVIEAAVDGVQMLENLDGVDCVAIDGDINLDGVVDGADLGKLLADWGPGYGASDLNLDGKVDGSDLGLLLANWSA